MPLKSKEDQGDDGYSESTSAYFLIIISIFKLPFKAEFKTEMNTTSDESMQAHCS